MILNERIRGENMSAKRMGMLLLALAICTSSSMPILGYERAFAAESSNDTLDAAKLKSLNIEEAKKLAVTNSDALKQLDKAIEQLDKGHLQAMEGKKAAESYYSQYMEFKKMYEEGAPTSGLDKTAYQIYSAMFGGRPTLSNADIYNQFIVPIEITHFSVYYQMDGLKKDRALAIMAIEAGIDKLFDGISSTEKSVALTQSYLKLSEIQLNQSNTKYKLGTISELELFKVQKNYEKAQIEYKKQVSTLAGLRQDLYAMCLIPVGVNPEIQRTSTRKTIKIDSFDKLLEQMKTKDITLLKAERNLFLAQRESEFMKKYILDESDDARINMENKLVSAEQSYESTYASQSVKLLKLYSNYTSQLKQLEILDQKIETGKKSVTKMEAYLKVGYVTDLAVTNEKLSLQQLLIQREAGQNTLNQIIGDISNQVPGIQ